ncbi:putative peroxisomal-coenzyme a synthetase [Phaeomoniella chlamydospora]|uniref:Putative peroxisomal-coenzyme a synthetase n=1 Tax=Phaeomoniella chlamydospora TaxID=158046 RepID=A0A0G2F2V9_PHACM|nr:putative peroxisomal-coenzyme a synthetase [Phaeomoniella chlamydospora]
MSTLANAFSHDSTSTAVIIPSRPALTVTYKELSKQILSFQKKLADLGIRHGAAVSIALPNSYEFIVSFLAAGWQRAIAAPLNSAYKQDEFEFYIDDLSSALALVPKGSYAKDAPAVRAARKYNAAIAECYLVGNEVVLDIKEKGKLDGQGGQKVEQPQPDDIALVLHTSGTTGRPKAVPLTHRNLTRTMKNIKATYELTPQDRTMLVMPLFHVHGLLAALLAPLAAGGSCVVPASFSARQFWDDFITHKANWYTAVPTIHQILLKNPPPNPKPNIRFIRSCSSALSPKTFQELEMNFGAPVIEAYAMTEASHQMTSNQLPHKGKRKPGSVGVGQGVEVKILDGEGNEVPQGTEAEICIRGENVTKGYLNNEKANKESFTKGGFFRTGDQGKKDEDGYVIITGRIKELINRAGEKISPIELDNVITSNPSISEAVCFAIPSELYGQEVGVAIVPKEGQHLTEQDVKDYVASKTAKFKVPTRVWILKEIPKTATGKIQRRKVADSMLAKDQPRTKL